VRDKKTETVYLLLDLEQVDSQIEHLQRCKKIGAESVLVMTSNRPDVSEKMERVLSGDLDSLSLDDLPDPDVVIVSTLYTIGLPAPINVLEPHLEEWSKG
jgi:hypothetical protein